MRTKDCSNRSGAARHTISVALFSVIWFTVCAATVIAAIEMPLSKFIKGGNFGHNKPGEYIAGGNQSDEHGNHDQSMNGSTSSSDSVLALRRTYRSFTLKQAVDSTPMLIDGSRFRFNNSPSLQEDMLKPIESLCMFISSGDTECLFSAIHPKLAEYLTDRFGAAIGLLGSSKVLLQQLAKSIINEDVSFIGQADSVDYEVVNIEELYKAQMSEIKASAEPWCSDLSILKAANIELRFLIKIGSDIRTMDSKLTVFKTTEGWFMDIGKALMEA